MLQSVRTNFAENVLCDHHSKVSEQTWPKDVLRDHHGKVSRQTWPKDVLCDQEIEDKRPLIAWSVEQICNLHITKKNDPLAGMKPICTPLASVQQMQHQTV